MSNKETAAGIYDQATQDAIAKETLAAYSEGLRDGEADLLDSFAMHALAFLGSQTHDHYWDTDGAATNAYNIAHAMMAKRAEVRRQARGF